MYKFAPAWEQETIVFGASQPGYTDNQVYDWIEFMKSQNIQRICCLLSEKQLANYAHLLDTYRQEFGNQQVCWTPIEDFHLSDLETLTQTILPFLITANQQNEKVVVHCAGGIGRTGHILAAWLVTVRGFSHQDAISAVIKTGRNPYEAVILSKNPLQVAEELNVLLNNCRLAFLTN
ncbi:MULTISPECIES: dual specificity protein phosphatase family protein [Aphanizomenonaceae]|uniref:Dual specificity protein phosphatase family protein n=1 Tax=Dolichospermum heterosporum TAC447 TaxID=747523 RepID=A0ABY5LTN4_9CYAN|nr:MULTISPECIES: dual specificity protein phosphatase family protein [Aphanizomenonaceae]MBE9256009.1 dual specificity protein phosphatase family protein [Dolichospermum sp. LEGE 00246]MDK2408600.1 dual specificity protein phosphatase family protein [Aphanizomenon sp. 202]MDK2457537.1 dual specificity protein phosphatase family protein [Aphanizomenon sp. PH219]UUO15322.1 dual specificity protein phosphatase family protein [Dolichospermum heterosporum TAC447]